MIEEIQTVVDWVQTAGFTGLLIVLAIPFLRDKIFGNGYGAFGEKIDGLTDKVDLMEDTLKEVSWRVEDLKEDGIKNKQ